MIIAAIVATAKNGVIGKEGGIPWYLPADLAHFKQTTMGHPIIMGRKTYQSIGRALPGRTSIVITRQKDYRAEDCIVVDSLERAIDAAKTAKGGDEIFIIGGQEIFKQSMPLLSRIYLTKIRADIKGDKFFEYEPQDWQEVSRESRHADKQNKYGYDVLVLERH